MSWWHWYLIAVNLFAFTLCAQDKHRAKRGNWRISERALLLSAALGGSLGLLCAMYLFRHKTRHKKFTVGVPLILLLHLALAGYLYLREGL